MLYTWSWVGSDTNCWKNRIRYQSYGAAEVLKFLCRFGKEAHDAYNNKLNSWSSVPYFLDSGIARAFDQRVFSTILEFHVSECVWAHVLWIQATGNAFRSLDPSFSIPMFLVENMIQLLSSKLQNRNRLTSYENYHSV